MRRWAFAAALITALGPWTTGHAEELRYYLDGQKLYSALASRDVGDRNFALGYLAGVSDTAQSDGFHCSPNTLTAGTLADVVQNELRDVPEYRTAPATHLVMLAMILHWPCEK